MRIVMRLISIAVRRHKAMEAAVFLCAIASATLGAFLLRFDFSIPLHYLPHLAVGVVCFLIAKTASFALLGLHHVSLRYVSSHDLLRLALANLAGSALGGALVLLAAPPGFPRSIYILDYVLCFGLTAWIRIAARLATDSLRRRAPQDGQTPALIYGAGDAGALLAREMQQATTLPYALAGFIDDDPAKLHTSIHGVKVLGAGASLDSVVAGHGIGMILIAAPSATGAQITAIVGRCARPRVRYKIMPPLGEVIESAPLFRQVRDVAVEDLLGRKPVRLETSRIERAIAGNVVLVTGAAGSIGAELCHQIARFGPQKLVGVDIGETPLFYLEMELKRRFPSLAFAPEIGDIRNGQRLDGVFLQHAPRIVFHAAAYKHVPMMEAHPLEALENNVFGTRTLAACAARHAVDVFVMVSTDKAVRPANIMGASKRAAELAINALQNGGTRFLSVRFGNVLGSNGSVIPIFKRQIAEGGPVTVTHPAMRRYFMTIPEAAQLVLQASTLGRGGEVFVLDMGEPVNITDLARNLILLSGLRPGEDIEIRHIGVREGEKLCEDIYLDSENTLPTRHEKIRVFQAPALRADAINDSLERLESACRGRDAAGLVLALKELVPEYNMGPGVSRRIMETPVAPMAWVD